MDMNKTWTRVAAVILAALLLWWLFWAILVDENINEMEMENTEIVPITEASVPVQQIIKE